MTTPSTASKVRSRLSAWSAEELQPSLLMTSLLTGGLIYVLEVVFAVSFTALVYTNELANYLPLAVGFTLLGDAVLCGGDESADAREAAIGQLGKVGGGVEAILFEDGRVGRERMAGDVEAK